MPRPRKTLPKGGLETIRQAASQGVREVDLAKRLGMSLPTWRKIRENDKDAAAAWAEARAIEEDTLAGELYRQAMEDKNPSAAMFLLKTRHGYREKGEDGQQAPANVTIALPPSMSPEQYLKAITQATQPAIEAQDDGSSR